jgi:acyl carrier protein
VGAQSHRGYPFIDNCFRGICALIVLVLRREVRTAMPVRDDLARFIKDSFLVDDFSDDESFLASGIIDSLGVMQLVAFIESEFGVTVSEKELVLENFDSVDKLVRYLERKRGAA